MQKQYSQNNLEAGLHRLRPYAQKVFEDRTTLSKAELEELEQFRQELVRTYTAESLTQARIYGRICGIESRSELNGAASRRAALQAEYERLEQKVLEQTASSDELARRNNLRFILEPSHYFG